MNIAFCYERVLPHLGGCEMYIASLARRLAADGHEVHLYAHRWDADALPAAMQFHSIALPRMPRFVRPWWFSAACARQLRGARHDATVGFDKIAGVDVLYPQAGVYAASVDFNLLKHRGLLTRRVLRTLKSLDLTHQSYLAVERAGMRNERTLVVAISDMVRRHMEERHGVAATNLRVLRVAPHADRFDETDRPRRRYEMRRQWELSPGRVVGLFAGMNYRLKGLEPLLYAMQRMKPALDLLVVGQTNTGGFERLAQRLGVADRVRFVGYCADMRDAYFAADLLVHPTFYDPCSNVVLEALACGLPVITTRHNGASEVMRPTGPHGVCAEGIVLNDPHDHARLAWSLEQMLDPARRTACAAAARRTSAEWTFEHHYERMLEILTEAAA